MNFKIFLWAKSKRKWALAILIFVIFSLVLISFYKDYYSHKSLNEYRYPIINSVDVRPGNIEDYDELQTSPSLKTSTRNSMLVKNAYMNVKVKSVDDFESKTLQWQQAHEATLLSLSFYKRGNIKEGEISMRIDKNDFKDLKEFIRNNSVEIAKLNIYGHDILDSYNDDLEQLKLLEATKEKIESFYDKANDVKSLMAIQRELLNVEQQIATVKRRTQNAEIQSKTMVITIYVITDESYKPVQEEDWKPVAVVKDAWSSLVKSLEMVVNIIIWILVYSVIWLPLLGFIVFIGKKIKDSNKNI